MSVGASLARHRRILLLPLVVVAGWLWLRSERADSPAEIHFRVGPQASSVRQIDLHFRVVGSDSVVHELSRRFPAGAPPELFERVHVPPGNYEIAVRLQLADGGERRLTRACPLAGRPVEVDLTGQ